ncbi:MAG: leucine-rich repeat domain-containing protein [Lachnospiraceae bacterium]|nr:leucine-rich repeat domain-containing protein [Lachnospiraceae bacterium]
MGNNEKFTYEYKGGSQFQLEQGGWYLRNGAFEIKGIETESERLYLPDTYKGNTISRWDMNNKERPLSTVKYLYIPASITEIIISNRLFPNLETIEVQSNNTKFSTDGQMLYSADGKELLYSLAAGNKESVVVPKTVKKIADRAFQWSPCTEITFENSDVSVESNTFEASGWLEKQGDSCIVGNMFYRLKRSMDILEVPENVKRFHEGAFFYGVPKHLITPIVPSRNNISHLIGKIYDRYGNVCEELTITRVNTALNFWNLGELSGLQKVHLPQNHKKYSSEDGVIFSKDKKTLVFYPRGRHDAHYEIPDGTVKIAREAFAEQIYLGEVCMPDTVTMLGMSAFYGCKALRKVVFSDNIKEIPDSSAYQNGGVCQACKALHEVTLPAKLQYLGSFAFYNSGLDKVVMECL